MISVTDLENYVLDEFAQDFSEIRMRRIYRGEMMVMLLRELWPERYAQLTAEFEALEAEKLAPPTTEAEVQALREKTEAEAAEYAREHGLPAPGEMKEFYDQFDVPKDERKYK